MAKIQNISEETKLAIKRKSAYSLPNNPTESGFKPSEIRNALFKPIVDVANSAVSEFERAVTELNYVLGHYSKDIDIIVRIENDIYYGSEGFYYSLDSNNSFMVEGFEGTVGESIADITEHPEFIIPSYVYYNGKRYTVTSIAEEAFEWTAESTVDIVIPDTVVSVGDKAFFYCSNYSVKIYGDTTFGTTPFQTASTQYITVPLRLLNVYKERLTSTSYIIENYTTVTLEDIDNKLDKVTAAAGFLRAYCVSVDGNQIVKNISEIPSEGSIPIYSSGGRLKSSLPVYDDDTINKSFLLGKLTSLGAKISLSIDPDTYTMTLKLVNSAGEVISSGEVDLPLESMIIGATCVDGILTLRLKTEDGALENSEVSVNISDIISGLVSETKFDETTANFEKRISELEETGGSAGADGEDGAEGLSIYRSTASATSSTTTINISTITVPTGRTLKVGDLIIANSTYSYLYRVTAVASSTVTVTYLNSLRGATGAKGSEGTDGAGVFYTATAFPANNLATNLVAIMSGAINTGILPKAGDLLISNATHLYYITAVAGTSSTSAVTATYLGSIRGDYGNLVLLWGGKKQIEVDTDGSAVTFEWSQLSTDLLSSTEFVVLQFEDDAGSLGVSIPIPMNLTYGYEDNVTVKMPSGGSSYSIGEVNISAIDSTSMTFTVSNPAGEYLYITAVYSYNAYRY